MCPARSESRVAPLTPELIYDAALRILDVEGVKGLNARRLTAELACSTKTLYQLVGNREAMERGIVARAFAQMRLDFRPATGWQESARDWARTLRSALLARPYLGALMTLEDREATIAYVVRLIDVLAERGMRRRDAIEVAGNLGHLTIGSALLDLGAPGEWDRPESFERTLDWFLRGVAQTVPVESP